MTSARNESRELIAEEAEVAGKEYESGKDCPASGPDEAPEAGTVRAVPGGMKITKQTKRTKRTVRQALDENITEAQALLVAIREATKRTANSAYTQKPNWADVGSAAELVSQLKRAAHHAGIAGYEDE